MGIFFALGAVFILPIYRVAAPSPLASIKPTQLQFTAKNQMYRFSIQNDSEVTLYSVCFALRIGAQAYSAEDFKIDIPEAYRKPISDDPIASKFGDTSGIRGHDSRGRGLLFLSIYSLAPKETRPFTLLFIGQKRSGEPAPEAGRLPPQIQFDSLQPPAEIQLEVVSWSTKTLPLTISPTMTLVPFELKETIKADGLIIWVLRP
jgi:hypothetical protein